MRRILAAVAPLTVALLVGVALGADGSPPADVYAMPLGELPLPAALVIASWILARWKPRLHIVVEHVGSADGERSG